MDFTQEERAGLYKAILTRRDVRTRFTQKPIPTEVLARILHAAHRAPSVGFSQPWNFILIKNNMTRRRIKESFSVERARSSALLEGGRRSHFNSLKLEGIMESFINICVTYDPTRSGPFVIGRNNMPQMGVYSVCCAVQNLWLAARSEGVGVGWVSILSNDVIIECLNLPQHIEPVAYLCIGYVEKFAENPDLEESGWLPRTPLTDVVDFEGWQGDPDITWKELDSKLNGVD